MNKSLGNLLRSLIGENPSQCDLALSQYEFTYNDSVKKSMGKSPFNFFYGWSLKCMVDLVALLDLEGRKSVDANDFVHNMHELQEQVKKKLQNKMIIINKEYINIGDIRYSKRGIWSWFT